VGIRGIRGGRPANLGGSGRPPRVGLAWFGVETGPAILFIARATWRDFVAEELRWVLFASQEAHSSTAAHIKSLLRPTNSADAISDLSYFLTDSNDSGLASLKV